MAVNSSVLSSDYDRKAVLTQKRLDHILKVQPNKRLINSLSTLSDQTTKLNPRGPGHGMTLATLQDYRTPLLKTNPTLWYIIECQLSGCLRISEVLQICSGDINSLGQIVIRGSKGSRDKIVSVSDSKDYLLKCRAHSVKPFALFSRQYCYRQFKKLGIQVPNLLGHKNAVTHSIRHLVISSMSHDGFDTQAQALVSGHKNHKNLEYYDHSKK